MRGRGGKGGRRHGHGRREYGRTTITVPCELKQRMKSVGDYVNWSSVACKAFESKLEGLIQQEEVENLDQVVERLRKLKAEREESDSFKNGQEVGKRWAMNRATPAQLDSIESFRSEMSDAEWRELFADRRGLRELADRLSGKRTSERRGGAHRFWREILDGRPGGTDFFAGFAEGAIDVWKSVKDRV